MAIPRRPLVLSLLLAAALPLAAQTPCVWDEQSGQIVQNCGKVGIGILAPWGGLHVRGTGQNTNSPQLTSSTLTQHGSTLFLQDSGGLPGNGGMVAFGALQGHFAAIKGFIGDGSANTTGNLLFLTRNGTADANLTERMRLHGNGHLAIGSGGDTAKLYVFESNPNIWNFNSNISATIAANGTNSGYGSVVSVNYHVNAGVVSAGGPVGEHVQAMNTGPGNVAQTAGHVIYSGANGGGTVGTAYGTLINVVGAGVTNGYGVFISDVGAANAFSIYQNGANDVNYLAGKVGIGTNAPAQALHVVGNVRVDGQVTGTNIQAQYQDVAEWVP